jgi:DnaJ family protein C protein 19
VKYLLLLALALGIFWALSSGTKRPRLKGMQTEEARRVLGLGPDADREAILDAHRRLIAKVHPDAGGSEELAGRVNAARDALLGGLAAGDGG